MLRQFGNIMFIDFFSGKIVSIVEIVIKRDCLILKLARSKLRFYHVTFEVAFNFQSMHVSHANTIFVLFKILC